MGPSLLCSRSLTCLGSRSRILALPSVTKHRNSEPHTFALNLEPENYDSNLKPQTYPWNLESYMYIQRRMLRKEPMKSLLKGSHRKDGVSEDLVLAYRNNLAPTIIGINICMHPMAVLSLIGSWWNIYEQWTVHNYCDLRTLLEHEVVQNSGAYFFAAIFFLYAARSILDKAFVRIYYDEKKGEFVGVKRKANVLSSETLAFVKDDVKRRAPGRILGHLRGNFFVKGKMYLISPADFRNPYLMNLMLGDKPEATDFDEEEEKLN